MKSFGQILIAVVFFITGCICIAGTDTNIIAMSEWSKPVTLRNDQLHDQSIRGRLVIVKGHEPAYGGSETNNGSMTFIELRDVTAASGDSSRIYFDVMKLRCQLSDATGKPVPPPKCGPYSGRGAFTPIWLTLPYNSAIRLFVNGGKLDPISIYPSGEPACYWSIPNADSNIYYLTGTLALASKTNAPPEMQCDYNATLVFPKFSVHPSDH